MSKRPWILLGMAVIALLVQYYSLNHSPKTDLEGEAQAFAKQAESAVQPWLAADRIWLDDHHQPHSSLWARTDWPKGFSFFLYQADSLHFWTDYRLPFPTAQISPGTLLLFPPHQRPHYLMHRSLAGGWTVSAAAPIPKSISMTRDGHQLLTAEQWNLRSPDQANNPVFWQATALLSWLLGSMLVLFFLDYLARYIAKRTLPVIGLAAAGLGLLVWWEALPYAQYPDFHSLQRIMNAPFFRWSLAQLLVLPPILLWLFSLSQRLFQAQPLPFEHRRWSGFFTTVAYLSIVLGLLACGAIFKTLLLESGLSFDFNNVLELSTASFAAMGALVFLLLLLLLYSLWIVRRVHDLQANRNRRLISLATALLLSLPIAWLLQLGIGLLPPLLMALLYVALLDLFVEIEAASPAWLLLWLAFLSAFSAGLLFKYGLDEGREQRLHFAQEVTYPVDAEAEQALDQLSQQLHLLKKTGQLDSLMLYLPYLNKNFRWQWLNEAQQQRLKIDSIKGHYAILPPNALYYTYGLKKRGSDSLLVFQPKLQQSRRVIKQLVGNAPQQSERYQLSLFYETDLIAQRGYFLRDWMKQDAWPTPGESREDLNSQRANLYYRPGNGYTVIVGENLGGYIKPISLFSYLFALLTLAALLLFGANRVYPFLPATPGHLLFGPPSLRHRVQLSVIALTLFAFLIISAVTVVSLQQSSKATQTERLLDKVEVLLRDMPFAKDSLIEPQRLRALSEVHQVDISCFDAKGKLVSSSVPFLFADGWQAPRINPEALRAKQRQGYKPAIIPEQAGTLSYLAAYVPVRRPSGEDWYIRIPFTSAERSVQRAALSFVGNLLNVYVFLLLIAGAIAITVANSITRPLMKIGEKLRSFQLGKNEPLEWDSEDEIGKLVAEYNAMIAKLEESAEKLRQSEREGAWREMAKQVAHEIKNPLTPMKLSIQYLQHAQKSDPERAAALISSVSQTLIEQIDGLARIATAFSNFAQMPKAENERFSLNDAVQNTYNLFTELQAPSERFRLELPEEDLYVLADRSHLNRVLTNLLKNAQQAIPEERQEEITLTLKRQGQQAAIRVQDNGSGIPPSIQPKVFQPNFTTKSSGMGLGLAMCKSMMEAAGGTIGFETTQDEGTTFTVLLPLA